VHIYNPNTKEAETGLSSRSAFSTQQDPASKTKNDTHANKKEKNFRRQRSQGWWSEPGQAKSENPSQ
jgi:hypothetical protein